MSGVGRYLRQHHVAVLALFVALGGTAYAAASISSNDIVDNSIKARDIRDGTIGSRDVGKNALSGADIDESTLDVSTPGGPGGPTGASGLHITQRRGAEVSISRGGEARASAECAPGEALIGGGLASSSRFLQLLETRRESNHWTVDVRYHQYGPAGEPASFFAVAECF